MKNLRQTSPGTFPLRTIWLVSLGLFILAVSTGFMYRWGMINGLPAGLSLTNLRHAHSHLMFFNWVTPIPMAFIARYIIRNSPDSARHFTRAIWSVIITGFLSYPFFLFYGYHPVEIGSMSLPFSVILSGVVMLCWYWFMGIYMRYRTHSPDSLSRLFYDGALILLFVSSLGAWGVAVAQFSGLENALLSGALTHFFLTAFTEGWAILAVLGLIYEFFDEPVLSFDKNWLIAPMVLGVPLMFPFGLSAELIQPGLLWIARAGAFAAGIGLLMNLITITTKSGRSITGWHVVLTLFAIKILMQLTASLAPSVFWIGEHGLRILYLHLLLAGFVTIVFITAWYRIHPEQSRIGLWTFKGTIILMLITLVMISGYWPASLTPGNMFDVVMIAALLPVPALILEFFLTVRRKAKNK
jgi:hypothetical protein